MNSNVDCWNGMVLKRQCSGGTYYFHICRVVRFLNVNVRKRMILLKSLSRVLTRPHPTRTSVPFYLVNRQHHVL